MSQMGEIGKQVYINDASRSIALLPLQLFLAMAATVRECGAFLQHAGAVLHIDIWANKLKLEYLY